VGPGCGSCRMRIAAGRYGTGCSVMLVDPSAEDYQFGI